MSTLTITPRTVQGSLQVATSRPQAARRSEASRTAQRPAASSRPSFLTLLLRALACPSA